MLTDAGTADARHPSSGSLVNIPRQSRGLPLTLKIETRVDAEVASVIAWNRPDNERATRCQCCSVRFVGEIFAENRNAPALRRV